MKKVKVFLWLFLFVNVAMGILFASPWRSYPANAAEIRGIAVTASECADGKIVFTIKREDTSLKEYIKYRTVSGTALNDVHYTRKEGYASFKKGDDTLTVTVEGCNGNAALDNISSTKFAEEGIGSRFFILEVIDSKGSVFSDKGFIPVSATVNAAFFTKSENRTLVSSALTFSGQDAVFPIVFPDYYKDTADMAVKITYDITQNASADTVIYAENADTKVKSQIASLHGSKAGNFTLNIKAGTSAVNLIISGAYFRINSCSAQLTYTENSAPNLLAAAPVYKYQQGQTAYISLIFDRIVVAKSAGASNISTSMGNMNYYGGAGTNVLVYSGVSDGGDEITVYAGAIPFTGLTSKPAVIQSDIELDIYAETPFVVNVTPLKTEFEYCGASVLPTFEGDIEDCIITMHKTPDDALKGLNAVEAVNAGKYFYSVYHSAAGRVLTGEAEITPKALTVTPAATLEKEYDGTNSYAESITKGVHFTVSGLLGSETVTVGNAKFNSPDVKSAVKAVASVSINSDNYKYADTVTFTAAIKPKKINVGTNYEITKIYDGNKAYGGETKGLLNVPELNNESVIIVKIEFDSALAGAGTAKIYLALDKGDNYALKSEIITVNAYIAPCPLTITAISERVYYGIAPLLEYKITEGALVKGDILSGGLYIIYSEEKLYAGKIGLIDAGSYNILSDLSHGCYEIKYISAVLKVEELPVTLTVNDASTEYGETPAFTYTVTSGEFIGNDKPDITYVQNETLPGAHKITATASCKNYAVTVNSGTHTVEKRNITVAVSASSAYYGEVTDIPQYKITSGTLVKGDSLSGGLYIVYSEEKLYAGEIGLLDAGSYNILSDLSHRCYEIKYISAVLKVEELPVTLTINDASTEYGETPSFTYTVTSGEFIGNDKPDIKYVQNETLPGAYKITAIASCKNYAVTVNYGTHTVEKRNITVAASASSAYYGEVTDIPQYKITSGTLVSGDSLSGCLYISGTDADSYEILSSINHSCYEISYISATFTIMPAKISIILEDQSSKYGENIVIDNTKYSVASGTVYNGDNLMVVIKKQNGSLPGEYALTAESGNGNYDVTVTSAKYYISKLKNQIIVDDYFEKEEDGVPYTIDAFCGNQILHFYIDGEEIENIFLSEGKYIVTIIAEENEIYLESDAVTVTLVIKAKISDFNDKDPDAPVTEPEDPVDPVEPVIPSEPEDPADPVEPVIPSEPEDPVIPTEPEVPILPQEETGDKPHLKIIPLNEVNMSRVEISEMSKLPDFGKGINVLYSLQLKLAQGEATQFRIYLPDDIKNNKTVTLLIENGKERIIKEFSVADGYTDIFLESGNYVIAVIKTQMTITEYLVAIILGVSLFALVIFVLMAFTKNR